MKVPLDIVERKCQSLAVVSVATARSAPSAAAMIPCFDPATREALGEVPVDTPDDVRAAVAAARKAQEVWGKTSFKQRRKVLRAMLDHILDHADELVDYVV